MTMFLDGGILGSGEEHRPWMRLPDDAEGREKAVGSPWDSFGLGECPGLFSRLQGGGAPELWATPRRHGEATWARAGALDRCARIAAAGETRERARCSGDGAAVAAAERLWRRAVEGPTADLLSGGGAARCLRTAFSDAPFDVRRASAAALASRAFEAPTSASDLGAPHAIVVRLRGERSPDAEAAAARLRDLAAGDDTAALAVVAGGGLGALLELLGGGAGSGGAVAALVADGGRAAAAAALRFLADEACENAAAIAAGGVGPLVDLLRNGSTQGRVAAARALASIASANRGD